MNISGKSLRLLLPSVSLLILSVFLLVGCKTQKETVLMKVYNQEEVLVEEVTVNEFLAQYKKNNLKKDSITKESIEDYVDLYVNYKLKVEEAEAMGMDTLETFQNELKGYRNQLAEPYLLDTSVTEDLIMEAYERSKFDIRASHILISIPREPSPEDTLAAWNKIMDAKKRIESGENFGNVAAELSDDPSAKDMAPTHNSPGRKGNRGDLGFFTVFDMVYPFETEAYNTPVGETSRVIRTQFGYHILKVTDRQPAMMRAFVSHIYVRFPQNPSSADSANVKAKADEIYQEYLKGDKSYEALALQYSDDKTTSENGGQLRWFTSKSIVPEFVDAINELEKDEVSKPVLTRYGYHIIKLLDREDVKPFKQVEAGLRQRIHKDSRALKSREEAVKQIKEEFGFKLYRKNLDELKATIDTTIFVGGWKAKKAEGLEKDVLKIGEKAYTQKDFAEFISRRQAKSGSGSIDYFFEDRLKMFTEKVVIDYKNEMLEGMYPKFAALMKEYHDGILLFNLMEKMIWGKSVTDTAGLEAFYETVKHNYMWPERLDATIYTCKDSAALVKTQELLKNGIVGQALLDSVNQESKLNLTVVSNKFTKGRSLLIDQIEWVPGVTKVFLIEGKHVFVVVHEVLDPMPKELNEVKGPVSSSYQEVLEAEWLEGLKKKYKVEIDQEALKSTYQK